MTVPAFVQAAYGDGRSLDPQPVLPAPPTAGNTIIEVLYDDANTSWPAINGWTKYATAAGHMSIFTRVVQAGDSATMPKVTTSNSGYTGAVAYEVSGIGSNFAAAVDQLQLFSQDAANTGTTTYGPKTTAKANSLAILCAFEWFAVFPATASINGGAGWTQDTAFAGGFAMTGTSGHQFIAGSGSNYQGTVNWNGTTPTHTGAALFNVFTPAPPPSGNGGPLLLGVG